MNKTRRRILKASLLGPAAVAAGCAQQSVEPDDRPAKTGPPLRLLVLGGTGFIGPHMVREALRRGHEVELFNRGRTNNRLFPDLRLYQGDRDNGLQALEGGRWDAVIDNSGYLPRLVGDSARMLEPAASHYLFISSISVYGDTSGPIDEDTATGRLTDETVEEITGETYGPLKALCEERVIAHFGRARSTILRPTYVCGPGDRTDRYTYWPVRTAKGGEMLWPGTPADPVQIIDVRDLAGFALDCVENRVGGIYNTVTPKGSFRMGDLLEDCLAVSGANVEPVWVAAGVLDEEAVRLPVWEGPAGRASPWLTVDGSRAAAAGLRTRPTRETARDTLAWWRTLPEKRTETLRAGPTAEREAELLASWRGRQA